MAPEKILFILCIVLLLSGGCSSKEAVYQGIYEGLQKREALVNPPNDPLQAAPSQSYSQYKAARDKSREDDTEQSTTPYMTPP